MKGEFVKLQTDNMVFKSADTTYTGVMLVKARIYLKAKREFASKRRCRSAMPHAGNYLMFVKHLVRRLPTKPSNVIVEFEISADILQYWHT